MAAQPDPEVIRAWDVPVRVKPSVYPEPYATRMKGRIKRQLGEHFHLRNFGVNLVVLPPGAVSALRHAHSVQDEFIYVLSGSPTLHTDAGERRMEAGQCVGFPGGTGNAHRLYNDSASDAVYVEVGDRSAQDSATYPDDDLRAQLEEGAWRFYRKNGEPY